jgi:hypothetical protein
MRVNNEPVSNQTRQLVIRRAAFQCEYCLIAEHQSFLGFEVDHIISRKHGGNNDATNLAYSCPDCNRNKGTDIASIDWTTNDIVRFYNPRVDTWAEHFHFSKEFIEPQTPIGVVTVAIFRFNDQIRLLSRGRFQ